MSRRKCERPLETSTVLGLVGAAVVLVLVFSKKRPTEGTALGLPTHDEPAAHAAREIR